MNTECAMQRIVRRELEYLADIAENLGQTLDQVLASVFTECAAVAQENAELITDTTKPVLALEVNFETMKAIAVNNGQPSESA